MKSDNIKIQPALLVERPIQTKALLIALGAISGLIWFLYTQSVQQALLMLLGLMLGISLYQATFGFTGAYRRAIVDKDISGVVAQMVMLVIAMLLFASVLSQGANHAVGAIAPASMSVAFGAFLFGVGMQLGDSCASGTLYNAGGGNLRMLVVLIFFCLGAFWGSLHLLWWEENLPSIGIVVLAESMGWIWAILLQITILGVIYVALRLLGARVQRELWWGSHMFSFKRLLRGPWPLLLSAIMLALLNYAVLLVAGHPWGVTWAFSLWAAKFAMLFGWVPADSVFWSGSFQTFALQTPLYEDTVTILNLGIVLGAFLAAALAGKLRPKLNASPLSLIAAVIGGVMMGYGTRLAYGCNIGAFFSGVATTSLHGWLWLLAAVTGNVLGVRLRPLFGLDGFGRHKHK
ncbi:MAG: hypothetical protein CVU29_11210 [Betaproteobacteria bacterium HGW-Betaproteobacteria-22]|nr:MAG: hypothetical protein CVU29_11210 [Betaproteobacteria bacterium HGW-Betaproteobacteria-22]